MVVTSTTRVRARSNVHAREFDGEWVIVDLAGGDYFGLDEMGGKIWTMLEGGRTPEEIAGVLVDEYAVDDKVLLSDIVTFVTDLAGRGLIEERR